MPSPLLSFRRPAFLGVAAPIFAVIFALASGAVAQPAPPAELPPAAGPVPTTDPPTTLAPAPPPPTPAPIVQPIYPPGPPAWRPPAPTWGQQPAPGYWPMYTSRAENPFALPPPAPKQAANPRLMTAGVLASVGGVAALITGAILMSVAKERIDVYRDGPAYCCAIDDAPMRNAGITMLVVGGITATVGIPLWMIGGRRVPVPSPTTDLPKTAPASAAPEVRVGLRGASLSWQF